VRKIIAALLCLVLALAACGEGPRRARVVGLNLDLEGVSEENIAAITAGDDSVIAALRGQLADTYGDGVDFDFYYSQPTADGKQEYVLFAPDAAEGNAGETPKDTVTLPMNGIKGAITPENRGEVVAGLFGQIVPQLGQWGYEAEETKTTPLPDPSKPPASSSSSQTQAPTTKTPTTTQKPETPGQYIVPETIVNPKVDCVLPQNPGNLQKTYRYDRFSGELAFAITNDQGKQLVIALRPADKNNPMKGYADIYTDENGDDAWERQRSAEQFVAPGAYEGHIDVLLDDKYSWSSPNGSGSMKIANIYWSKEGGWAMLSTGTNREVTDAELAKLQNAGRGVGVIKAKDGSNLVYYK
jgi:hypothetical protein